jgi:threonyl-tRNA synthetase
VPASTRRAADDGLGKRIRNAKLEKIPYVLVVGDDDVAAGTVGVNPRGDEVERGVPVDRFVEQFLREMADAESAALGA